jgi:hypothetical protein
MVGPPLVKKTRLENESMSRARTMNHFETLAALYCAVLFVSLPGDCKAQSGHKKCKKPDDESYLVPARFLLRSCRPPRCYSYPLTPQEEPTARSFVLVFWMVGRVRVRRRLWGAAGIYVKVMITAYGDRRSIEALISWLGEGHCRSAQLG